MLQLVLLPPGGQKNQRTLQEVKRAVLEKAEKNPPAKPESPPQFYTQNLYQKYVGRESFWEGFDQIIQGFDSWKMVLIKLTQSFWGTTGVWHWVFAFTHTSSPTLLDEEAEKEGEINKFQPLRLHPWQVWKCKHGLCILTNTHLWSLILFCLLLQATS